MNLDVPLRIVFVERAVPSRRSRPDPPASHLVRPRPCCGALELVPASEATGPTRARDALRTWVRAKHPAELVLMLEIVAGVLWFAWDLVWVVAR